MLWNDCEYDDVWNAMRVWRWCRVGIMGHLWEVCFVCVCVSCVSGVCRVGTVGRTGCFVGMVIVYSECGAVVYASRTT
jgi:hypothetical protein